LLVAYDERSGAFAARLWWLMRYYGQKSALLDGGLAAWIKAGLPLETKIPELETAPVESLWPDESLVVSAETIVEYMGSGKLNVIDARPRERYSGEDEWLDSRAGHIPGSLNRYYAENLDSVGRFKPASELRAEFEVAMGGADRTNVVHSCGSGVTACHNLFAMELAGLTGSRIYPGSWSEWIRDPNRPIESGP